MRIVCQQTILMKYHALFDIFEKAEHLKLLSAAKCRCRFMVKKNECNNVQTTCTSLDYEKTHAYLQT